ncbi:MAG TPA: hypothetical protein VFL42_01360 [Terriglobales bacterium]|nr:hypothetical protein [Terriglobales bacterium]
MRQTTAKLAVTLLIMAAWIALRATHLTAAAAEPEKLFRVGMTQAEMHAAFGEPQSYLELRTQRHLTRKEFLAAGGVCACRPLYGRKTANNEYEIVIFEKSDDSGSRLHPVIRVEEVRFTLDHDMSPEEALADIAEAKTLCAGRCTIKSDRFAGVNASRPEINVQFGLHFSDKNPKKVESVQMWAKK